MTQPPLSLEALLEENRALRQRLELRDAGGGQRAQALRFFHNMDRVQQVARRALEVDELLEGLLDEMLDIFGCDRAWLLYPCDPEAPSWRVPMERSRPEYPGAFTLGVEIPMDELAAAVFAEALASDEPLPYDSVSGRVSPPEVSKAFQIQSQMIMAVHPRGDSPWLLGIHHCAEAQVYGEEEQRVLKGICTRAGDWLGTMLLLRDLRESERRFRTLVEHAPEAIVVTDVAGRFLHANGNAAELFGVVADELVGRAFIDVSPLAQPDGRNSSTVIAERLQDALAGGAPRFEWTHVGASGEQIACEVRFVRLADSSEARVRASIVDVSERVALQTQVHHLQKMEAIGELAGGVAHDFNNQLVAVLCHADLLRYVPGVSPAVIERADGIVAAAQSAADLTRQLLAFSRRALLRPETLDVNEAVARTTEMLERIIGSHLHLEVKLDHRPARAYVDPDQFQQVLVNLVTNARDAVSPGGTVKVETQVRRIDVGDREAPASLAPGRYVVLSVSDDGAGMDGDTASRVFEPFFTTKRSGKGTGLGLSTAYGVIEQSGGTITVLSARDEGTVFRVFLPEVVGEVWRRPTQRPSRPTVGGSERILLVEDHGPVAEVMVTALTQRGYAVEHVADGAVALGRCETHGPFDLLLTDVVIPGIDGVDLADHVIANYPNTKVLFATGYSIAAIERLVCGNTRRAPLLQKPYTAAELLVRVRSVLDA